MIKKKATKKATGKANTKATLTRVSKNIYQAGNMLRVIKTIDGVRHSKYCPTLKTAKQWLNAL